MLAFQIFFIGVIIPFVVSFLFCFFLKKYHWISCVLVYLAIFIKIILEIYSYGSGESSLLGKISFYFSNDASMGVTLFYVPILISTTLFVILFSIIRITKQKKLV